MFKQQGRAFRFTEIHHGSLCVFADIDLGAGIRRYSGVFNRFPFGFFGFELLAPNVFSQVVHGGIDGDPV